MKKIIYVSFLLLLIFLPARINNLLQQTVISSKPSRSIANYEKYCHDLFKTFYLEVLEKASDVKKTVDDELLASFLSAFDRNRKIDYLDEIKWEALTNEQKAAVLDTARMTDNFSNLRAFIIMAKRSRDEIWLPLLQRWPKEFEEQIKNQNSSFPILHQNVRFTLDLFQSQSNSITNLKGATNKKYPLIKKMLRSEPSKSRVVYLTKEEADMYEVFIDGTGKLVNANGTLLDTSQAQTVFGSGKAIFAMDESGRIFVSTYQGRGIFHHSSFVNGGAVAAAGEMEIVNGTLKMANRKSGHYLPPEEMFNQLLEELKTRGANLDQLVVEDP